MVKEVEFIEVENIEDFLNENVIVVEDIILVIEEIIIEEFVFFVEIIEEKI